MATATCSWLGSVCVLWPTERVCSGRIAVEGDTDHVVDVQQHVVVRGDEHGAVKGQIGLDEGVGIVNRRPELGHRHGDGPTLRRAGQLGRQAGGAWFKCDSQVGQHLYVVGRRGRGVPPAQYVRIEQVPRLAWPDPSAGTRTALQQSLSSKDFHAFAKRRPADVELADQLVFRRNSGTRWQLAAHDLRAEAVHDLRVAGLIGIGGSHGVRPMRRCTDESALHQMKFEIHLMKHRRTGGRRPYPLCHASGQVHHRNRPATRDSGQRGRHRAYRRRHAGRTLGLAARPIARSMRVRGRSDRGARPGPTACTGRRADRGVGGGRHLRALARRPGRRRARTPPTSTTACTRRSVRSCSSSLRRGGSIGPVGRWRPRRLADQRARAGACAWCSTASARSSGTRSATT